MHLPTQREIRQACLAIQATWTPEDFYRRRQGWAPDLTLTDAELDAEPTESPLIDLEDRQPTESPPAKLATQTKAVATPRNTCTSLQHVQHSVSRFYVGDRQLHIQFAVGRLGFRAGHSTEVHAADPLVGAILKQAGKSRAQMLELVRDAAAEEIKRLAREAAAESLLGEGLAVGEILDIP